MVKISPHHYAQALLMISEEQKLDESLENFFNVIKTNGQTRILPEILNEYRRLAQEKKEGVEASLTIAENENRDKISEMIKGLKISGVEKFKPKTEIDKNLLGGFVLRIKDALIDASLKKQITSLKKSLI